MAHARGPKCSAPRAVRHRLLVVVAFALLSLLSAVTAQIIPGDAAPLFNDTAPIYNDTELTEVTCRNDKQPGIVQMYIGELKDGKKDEASRFDFYSWLAMEAKEVFRYIRRLADMSLSAYTPDNAEGMVGHTVLFQTTDRREMTAVEGLEQFWLNITETSTMETLSKYTKTMGEGATGHYVQYHIALMFDLALDSADIEAGALPCAEQSIGAVLGFVEALLAVGLDMAEEPVICGQDTDLELSFSDYIEELAVNKHSVGCLLNFDSNWDRERVEPILKGALGFYFGAPPPCVKGLIRADMNSV